LRIIGLCYLEIVSFLPIFLQRSLPICPMPSIIQGRNVLMLLL